MSDPLSHDDAAASRPTPSRGDGPRDRAAPPGAGTSPSDGLPHPSAAALRPRSPAAGEAGPEIEAVAGEAPPHLPDDPVAEARAIAEAQGWSAFCPDPACRDGGRCGGRLRPVGPGRARTHPTCLAICWRALGDRDGLTLREADAFLCFLHGEPGWTLRPRSPEAT